MSYPQNGFANLRDWLCRFHGGDYCGGMVRELDEEDTARLAKIMAMLCVRNTMLEKFHCGMGPVTKTADFSDVKVVHAEGEIPWNELSRISDPEMQALMKQVVNRLFTFFTMSSEHHDSPQMSLWQDAAKNWDDPEIDELLLRTLEDYPPASEGS